MKKTLIFSTLILLAFSPSYAQLKTKVGIGLSVSDFSESPGGDTKAQPGFQIGTSFVFGNKLYLEPGLYYTVKSTEYVSSGSSSVSEEAVINGLRVPVAVGLGLIGGEDTTIGLRAFGGFSGFFVTGTGDDIEKDDVESPSWGTFVGAGVDFWILYMDLSYEWSLTNIQKDVSSIDLGKHRSFYVTVGIWLGKKGGD